MVRLTLFIAALAVSAATLPAQQGGAPAPRPTRRAATHDSTQAKHAAAPVDTVVHFSGVVGVAVDSVHGGPLAGATVSVVGTNRQAVTDSAGQFRIDSVPPGAYRLNLSHPVLDTLGLAIATQEIAMPLGRYAVVRLATPSQQAVLNVYCPKERMVTGPGAVIGRVLDADTDAPDTGAHVMLVWTQLEVGAATGVHRLSRVRDARVESDGMFRICGIPTNIQAALHASRGKATTAEVSINPQGDVLSLALLHLAAPDTTPVVASAAPTAAPAGGASAVPATVTGLRRGHATVAGRVTDLQGRPLSGATVTVDGAASTTQTMSDGSYTLRELPAGTQALVVRKLTFAPTRVAVDLSNRRPWHADVQMRPAPPSLPTVVVEGKRDKGLRDVGFSTRQKAGLGHYITEDQIAERQPMQMTDIFTTMPGIHVDYSSGYPMLRSSRDATGGCVSYVIDGIPQQMPDPQDFNDFMHPDEVSAIEVYSPSEAPAQFTTGGNSSCEVIVIWTKTKVGG